MLGEILSQLVLMLGAYFIAYYFLCYDNCQNCGMKKWEKRIESRGSISNQIRVCAVCNRKEHLMRVGNLKEKWVENRGVAGLSDDH